MSDIPADYRARLDVQEQIERIDRMREETRKFTAEQHKLMAEERKYNRDWWIVPLTVIGAIIAGIVARLPEILHALGIGG